MVSVHKSIRSAIETYLTGLKQKLSPNQAQTGFISGKYVHIFGSPELMVISLSNQKRKLIRDS